MTTYDAWEQEQRAIAEQESRNRSDPGAWRSPTGPVHDGLHRHECGTCAHAYAAAGTAEWLNAQGILECTGLDYRIAVYYTYGSACKKWEPRRPPEPIDASSRT